MKHVLLNAFLLLTLVTGFSQARYLYYFDKDLNLTRKSNAVFNGVGIYLNDTLELNIYNSQNNQLIAVEHYTDSALSIENGLFLSYHNDASLAFEGSFVMGNKEGLWRQWNIVGNTIDSTIYRNGKKIMEVHTGYHKNGSLDSFIVNDLTTDRLEKTFYNDKGQMLSETKFIGQDGIVKYYDKDILTGTYKVSTRAQTEAYFPGGEEAWTRYIKRQIEKNIDALTTAGISGTCRLKFIVDKEGNVKNVEALTMQGTVLAEVAVKAIERGSKWKPAIQYGRPLNAFREQPVSFRIEGR